MSDPRPVPGRPATLHLLLIALLGSAIVGAIALIVLRRGETTAQHTTTAERVVSPVPSPSGAAPPAAIPAPTPPPSEPQIKPSFDIVRVNPQGNAVLAGRAAPGAEVAITRDGQQIGRVQADQQGTWVFVPLTPLPPGAQELALSEHDQTGRDIKGDGSVLMVVPTPPSQMARADAQPTGAIAVLSTPSAAPKMLQAAPGPTANAVGRGRLSLDTLEYDDRGEVRFIGTAPAGSSVRIYSDRQPIGGATAGRDGRWTLTPEASIAPGTHDLRVDQLTARGEVVARVGMPFQREQLAARAVAEGGVVVQPGQNLWLLARRAYGTGFRYTVIYQANRGQIRDPDLIYPGQTFAVPMLAAGGEDAAAYGGASASSRRSR
jgi:hypothetical protein